MKSPATLRMLAFLLALAGGGGLLAAGETNAVAPVTARDFYNAGTKLLAATNFAEAERMFQSALAAQDERVQPPALYNLGQTRFAEGVETLKKGPEAKSVLARGQAVSTAADRILQSGRAALAENDTEKIIGSYFAGRGMRKELRAAEAVVRQAMETHGTALRKWQRAADDFKGAAELNPAATNATRNAELVEQHIARLVDSLRAMQQMASQLGNQRQQMGDLLSQLKGKMPQLNAPPGDSGDDEEDEEGMQPDSLAGQKENPSREGEQMTLPLSPDAAGQLLDGLGLNGTRRLSMSDTNTSRPKDKTGRTW